MTDTTKLPPLPIHPEPHTYRWTEHELRAIEQYGAECRRAALDEAALAADAVERAWGRHAGADAAGDCARAIRALKDKA